MTQRTAEEIRREMLNYFTENEEDFESVLFDLDSWNGYLNDNRWYNMDELDELTCGMSHWEVARAIHFGDFNPMHDYFKFDAYGNLESTDYPDYSDYLDEYFIDEVIENAQHLDLPVEIMEALEELEALEEEEDEAEA